MIALNLHRRAFERGIDRQAFLNFFEMTTEGIREFMEFRKYDRYLTPEMFQRMRREGMRSFLSEMKETEDTTLWEVLGVSRSATPQEIKAAFRKMSLANHP